jgi:hypothetical protein
MQMANCFSQPANLKAIPPKASGKPEFVDVGAKVGEMAVPAGATAMPVTSGVKTCAEVNNEMLNMLDPNIPGYKSFQYDASTYDVPDSEAFKFFDVVVDSEVHVDLVPSYEDISKNR